MSKFDKMARFIPTSTYKPDVNPKVRSLLLAWSNEDDKIVQAIKDAKEQLFVKTAQFQYLDSLGSNVGVFRPTEFNLADEQYRELIPTLSFKPKQVMPTVKKVLEIFFQPNNPKVAVHEININEVVIEIPSTVPSLRRTLRGSIHIHSFKGLITYIDNVGKELDVTFVDGDRFYPLDELAGASIGQGSNTQEILSSTSGTGNITLQFDISADLSVFNLTDNFVLMLPNYPSGYIPDPTKGFTVTSQRGKIGQNIVAGNIYTSITMQDASRIPDAVGYLSFNDGFSNEESLIKYFGRPNNSTLLLDPSYIFQKNHTSGDLVNIVVTPYLTPRKSGIDYSIYLVGVEAARILAQRIIESILASGVKVRWIISEPTCIF